MAELLEKVLENKITAEEALKQTNSWPKTLWEDQILADAWHALKHFEIDRDVTAKNAKLAQLQTKSLLRWVKLLRETI
jgi:hypothetical protein